MILTPAIGTLYCMGADPCPGPHVYSMCPGGTLWRGRRARWVLENESGEVFTWRPLCGGCRRALGLELPNKS